MQTRSMARLLSNCTAILMTIGATAAPMSAQNALGNVDFQTSCNTEANAAFNEGLGLLHHMMYLQADAVFSDAAAIHSDCAMLHWGTAMSKFHPLWPGLLRPEALEEGRAAVERMKAAAPGSEIERAFATAVSAFYASEDASYPARKMAWAGAQLQVHDAFIDDVEATAFGALALLTSAPRGDATFASQRKAGALMEALNETTDLHPGVYHYAIHAYDNPLLYPKGLPFAHEYGRIAPDVPHALHMPSHIYVRAGDWDQVIDWNIRSAQAALAQPAGDMISGHYAHAMDYLIYGHLQRGAFAEAKRLLAEFLGHQNIQANFGSAYALAAAPVRVALEQDQWAELARMDGDMHAAIPWDKFPQAVAMLWFAIGLGAARSGDLDRAQVSLDRLAHLRAKLDAANSGYWRDLTDSQILSVEAWVAFARGNPDTAISLQSKAADIEDAAGKAPVTPGHVLPARELLGDLHMAAGNDAQAIAAYNAALQGAPNRRRSVNALN